jgi:hypothetical protein
MHICDLRSMMRNKRAAMYGEVDYEHSHCISE